MTQKERLEQLITQYKDVSQKALEFNTLKTKLEGAIELTQSIIKEEEDAAASKEEPKKEAKK
tara:strand:+ start:364 stop:549 length:186 start_codon:yes stop_codon:yes gene_type:complete